MGFVQKKRGSVVCKPFLGKRADILHEIYFLIFQLFMVFVVVIALVQYINNVATDLGFEKKFTALDIGLLTTTVYSAPGTLIHDYVPIPFPVPMDFIFSDSTVNIKERGKELNMMYWYLSDKNLDVIGGELDIPASPYAEGMGEELAQLREAAGGANPPQVNFTYYKSGRQVVFGSQEANPLQLVCPVINTTDEGWQSKKVFIAKVLPGAEDYANLELPVNRIAQILSSRYSNMQVAGPGVSASSSGGGSLISAIPADADIVIILGDSGEDREPGSLVAYVPINSNLLKTRKFSCFLMNDLLTPETVVFYSQIMPVYTDVLADQSPLRVLRDQSSTQQVILFLDIAKFSDDQVDVDNTALAIYRAIERYYGGYELGEIAGATFSFVTSASPGSSVAVSAEGAGASLGTGGAAGSGVGDKVVVYLSEGEGSAEFMISANRIAQSIGAEVHRARNAEEILQAVRAHQSISRLILAGHGSSRDFWRPGTAGIRLERDSLPEWVSVGTFAAEIAPRLSAGAVIGLAGCSAAANPGESNDVNQKLGPGGENGFAAKLRDALASQSGIATGIEVRAHSTVGHLSHNPFARVFRVSASEVGRPGVAVIDEMWGQDAHSTRWEQWRDTFRGDLAEQWISGDDVRVA